jgi:hypothetical protein
MWLLVGTIELKLVYLIYRKTSLLVPGLGLFSNSNSFVLDKLQAQINFKTPTNPIQNPV